MGVDIHSGTVFAEKLETVISRNIANTCMRDFYDIYILQKLYGEQLSKNVLWVALVATVKKRGTLGQIEAKDIDEAFDEIQSSPVMEYLWKAYLGENMEKKDRTGLKTAVALMLLLLFFFVRLTAAGIALIAGNVWKKRKSKER